MIFCRFSIFYIYRNLDKHNYIRILSKEKNIGLIPFKYPPYETINQKNNLKFY